jgi:ATP-dependent DNA ligase
MPRRKNTFAKLWLATAPLEVRKATLASVLAKAATGLRFNEPLEHDDGGVVFRHACKMGLRGASSRSLGSRSSDWLKMKNPHAPAFAKSLRIR